MAKPKDLKYEELLLHKRLEYFDKLQDALKDDESIASLSVDVLTSIVDDVIKEVALEVHRAVKTGVDDLSDIRKQARARALSKKRQSPSEGSEERPVAKRTRSGGGARIIVHHNHNKTKSKTNNDVSSLKDNNIADGGGGDGEAIPPASTLLDTTTEKPTDKKKSGKSSLPVAAVVGRDDQMMNDIISAFETTTAAAAAGNGGITDSDTVINNTIITTTATATAAAAAPKGQMIDVFGNIIQPIALDPVICPNCTRKIAAGRFAPHLDKCTGRGRQASRVAQHRMSTLAMDQ